MAHQAYRDIPAAEIRKWFAPDRGLVLDVKGFFDRAELAALGLELWRL